MLIPAARLAGVPVVLGSHRQLGDLLTPAQFRLQAAVFRLCDRIVCNSHAAGERLHHAGIAKRSITIIPNGLTPQFFDCALAALPSEPEVLRIGMISRMNHQRKNHDLFLRIAARLSGVFPHLRFVLAGDGPLRPDLENLARQLGIGHRVLFLGDRRDVPAVLAALDMSVLTSSSESLSNVIMESMAAGVPVVAANVGGNSELVHDGKTGLLVASVDEAGFVSALQRLIVQPELRKSLGSCAHELACAEYTCAKARERYQDLYCNLLVEKGWSAAASLKRWKPAPTTQQEL
jgi:L-malate glycosyltransferase